MDEGEKIGRIHSMNQSRAQFVPLALSLLYKATISSEYVHWID